MQPNTPLILFSLLLGLFCVTGLVEHSLYGGFNRTYYTHGLPFVSVRILLTACRPDIPSASLLEAKSRSNRIGSLVFQQIAPNTYGFRRQFFQGALVPNNLMHGMLLFDQENGQVILKCFVNILVLWLVLVIGVFMALGPFSWIAKSLALGVAVLIIGLLLLVERWRCIKVAGFAARAWAPDAEVGS